MQRRFRGEDGFSLVELMIVVAIVGVLVGIALPTFMGSRTRAADTAAQGRARDGHMAQKTFAADGNGYAAAADLAILEPNLQFAELPAGGATASRVVYVKMTDPTVSFIVSKSATGRCFWIKEAETGTGYASDDCSGDPTSIAYAASEAAGWNS